MDDQKHNNRKGGAPSELELARIAFDDELGLALDNVRGAAHILDKLANNETSEEAAALYMLSSHLRESVERVQAERDKVLMLEVEEGAK